MENLIELKNEELQPVNGGFYNVGSDAWGTFVYWLTSDGYEGSYTSYYA